MNCPNCNKDVFPDWNSCPHCGYKPKKCSNSHCNSGWLQQDARFCPECGGPLKGCIHDEIVETTSIMKLYPKLYLVPTSLVRRSGFFGLWVLYIVVLLVFIGLLVWGLGGVLAGEYKFLLFCIVLLIFGVVMSVLWGVLFYKKILYYPKGGYRKLVKEADYLSGNRGLCIFVKDKRFGLIKLWSCSIFIPPIYDYMEWETRNKYLRVIKDGSEFLIDIYNNNV